MDSEETSEYDQGEKDEVNKGLVLAESESRATGRVGLKVVQDYFQAGGGFMGVWIFCPLGLLLLLSQGALMTSEWFLAQWIVGFPALPWYAPIVIYCSLGLMVMVISTARSIAFFYTFLNSSQHMFGDMLGCVLHAPLDFFTVNPQGRILNRFSKDQALVDEILPTTFFDFLQGGAMVLGSIILVSIVTPWVLLFVGPVTLVFYYYRSRYVATSREVKRLEATSRSPVYSFLSSTLEGLATIRAFAHQDQFIAKFFEYQDANTRSFLAFLLAHRWAGVRLDLLSALFLGFTAFVSVLSRGSIDPYLIGLSLTYALQLSSTFQWVTRQSAETENLCEY